MISVIVPTYNESKNVPELISRLDQSFHRAGIKDFEILIMDDDSPDGTAQMVMDMDYRRARAINRKGKPRGLSHAVIDGFAHAAGNILVVMDADLSHPTEKVPELVRAIQGGSVLAVGSRYVRGGGTEDWPFLRQFSSRAACWVARIVTPVKDATSGFFAVRKDAIEGITFNPAGFKIGLEVFVKSRHQNKITEVPIMFKDRIAGESKLSGSVIKEYFKQVFQLATSRS